MCMWKVGQTFSNNFIVSEATAVTTSTKSTPSSKKERKKKAQTTCSAHCTILLFFFEWIIVALKPPESVRRSQGPVALSSKFLDPWSTRRYNNAYLLHIRACMRAMSPDFVGISPVEAPLLLQIACCHYHWCHSHCSHRWQAVRIYWRRQIAPARCGIDRRWSWPDQARSRASWALRDHFGCIAVRLAGSVVAAGEAAVDAVEFVSGELRCHWWGRCDRSWDFDLLWSSCCCCWKDWRQRGRLTLSVGQSSVCCSGCYRTFAAIPSWFCIKSLRLLVEDELFAFTRFELEFYSFFLQFVIHFCGFRKLQESFHFFFPKLVSSVLCVCLVVHCFGQFYKFHFILSLLVCHQKYFFTLQSTWILLFSLFHPHQLDKRIFHIFPIYLIFSCSHVSLDTFPRFHFQDSPVPCSNRSPLIFSCFSFFHNFSWPEKHQKKIIAKRDFSPILSVQRLLTNCFKNCGIAIVLLSFVRLLHARARAREKKKSFCERRENRKKNCEKKV